MASESIFKVFEAAYALPGVKVNRNEFLRSCFKDNTNEMREKIVNTSPVQAGVSLSMLDAVAKKQISEELVRVSGLSAVSGGVNIGGWSTAAGFALADLTQYFAHCLRICQKLAYIYGWPDMDSPTDLVVKIDDNNVRVAEFVLVGCMFGVNEANKLVVDLSTKCMAKYVGVRGFWTMISPPVWFKVVNQVGKVIGINISKELAKRSVTKIVPVIGAVTSGALTYYMFNKATDNLFKTLSKHPMRNW